MDFNGLNEKEIAKVEAEVYGGQMPVHNKGVLRAKLEAEDRFYANEEREHSHSSVGDHFNQRVME